MKINSNTVSFGQRIPIAKGSVIDSKNNNKLTPVTVYQLDCCDISDAISLSNAEGTWNLRSNIQSDMKDTYIKNCFDSTRGTDSRTYYILTSDSDDEILSMAETIRRMEDENIRYIESRRDNRFKYSGQTMVATLGLDVLNKGKPHLGVEEPLPSAYDFYTKKCGFYAVNDFLLQMDKKRIKKFIDSIPVDRKVQMLDVKI